MPDLITEWLTCGLTDRDVLGDIVQEMDKGQDFVEGNNNYVWLYLIARELRPKFIVETGTRFGYSLKSFIKGAGWDGQDFTIRSFDSQFDGIDCLDTCERYLREKMGIANIVINRNDTRNLMSLGCPGMADLGFVDADHTEQGCVRECGLVWEALRPGGVMLVDDILNGDVKRGAERWMRRNRARERFIPTLRGLYLIQKA